MAFDFGSLKGKKTVAPKPVTPKVPHTDWKKQYEQC